VIVPSVIATSDFNALVNPYHPDAMRIEVADPAEFKFDLRLAR
jgi:RES domain-containing protein